MHQHVPARNPALNSDPVLSGPLLASHGGHRGSRDAKGPGAPHLRRSSLLGLLQRHTAVLTAGRTLVGSTALAATLSATAVV